MSRNESPAGLSLVLASQIQSFGAPIMDTVLSFLISAGIIAFGVWVVAGTIAAGWPLAWTLMGLLPVIVGSISLYGSVLEAKKTV
jgi:hypothetical protein